MNAPVGVRTHRSAPTDCRGGRPACRPAIILTPYLMASRRLISLALLVAGVAAIALAFRRSESEAGIGPLRWIATAHQFGPVGYRDPAGAISPDGQWIAYSEGRFLRVRAIEGGPVVELPPEEAQIRNISWTGDSRTILADGYGTQAGWAMYDI